MHSNHLKHGPYELINLLSKLFSAFISHSFLPAYMIYGSIKPIIKNKLGDKEASDNYRPVMSQSTFLKTFEYCLKTKIENLISLNERQHGFRKRYSTVTACLTVKETIKCYLKNNSKVYACFLDLSKAFDNVDHFILFDKLQKLQVPDYLLNIIKFMYRNQTINVAYKNCHSNSFKVENGVRQGAILSPMFFNLYINDVLNKITDSKIGCKLGYSYSNTVAYTDDLTLFSPNPSTLQKLINIVNDEIRKLKLKINVSKCFVMIFVNKGRACHGDFNFYIERSKIEITDHFKYLGFVLNSNLTEKDDLLFTRDKFFREFNCIMRKFSFTHETVLIHLFNTYCSNFYGSQIWLSKTSCISQIREFGIAYHKALKKILKIPYYSSNVYVYLFSMK